DMGCHYIDLAHWALGLTAPESVTATGKKTYEGDNGVPDVMRVDYRYPARKANPPVHLTWYHGVGGPEIDGAEKVFPGFGSGVMLVGEKATLISDYNKH